MSELGITGAWYVKTKMCSFLYNRRQFPEERRYYEVIPEGLSFFVIHS